MTLYRDVHGEHHERPETEPVRWRVSGYGVIERDGRLLLMEPIWADGWTWNLPGGGIHLDPEETIIGGIVREVLEETGYLFTPDPTSLTLVGDQFLRSPSGRFWRSITFTVHGTVGEAPEAGWTVPDDEIVRVEWVDPTELRQHDVQWFHWETLVKLGYRGRAAP